jgi:putative transposase
MRIRNLNHSRYQIVYHIVWGTRYRRKYIKEYTKQELRKYLFSATKKYPTLHIFAFNTNDDHVHLQIEIPPNLSVATVVQRLKSESSAHLKKKFKFIRDMYLDGSIWSVGYFVSTVGLNEASIRKYIANQGRKDLGTTERSEFS